MMPTPPLAYHDPAFLDSDEGRPVRIVSEYLAPLRAFNAAGVTATVVFSGSARVRAGGPVGRYVGEAMELARLVTEWSRSLAGEHLIVCSGGGPGIMEAANQGAALARGPRRRPQRRSQHRPAARAASQSLYHPGAGLRVPLLLHAQAVVRTPGARAGGVSRRLRHVRRAIRDPDAGADPQARAFDSRVALRFGVLERSGQLRGSGAPRHHRDRGSAAVRVRG